MKILEIQDGKLTLEYYDGSIVSVTSKEHALTVIYKLNLLELNGVLANGDAEGVRLAIMIAFRDINSLEVYSVDGSGTGAIESRQKYRQKLVDEVISKIVSANKNDDRKHTIHLIRGVGGSGKSTFAKKLQDRLMIYTTVETDIIKRRLFDDYWFIGRGVAPEPRQLHQEASHICRDVVDLLCEQGISFILVQRFEKIEDAKRVVHISERYGYEWHIYSIIPDFIDIARNNITRSRSLYNINTFSPESLQKSILKYSATASYFYRLAAHHFVRSICDVRQQPHGNFSETYYKKDGTDIYVNRNPSIHVPLLSSRESSQVEDYAIFRDADMHKYQNFFYRDAAYEDDIKYRARRCVMAVSRTTNGVLKTDNKESRLSRMLGVVHASRNQIEFLDEIVNYVYNKRYVRIETEDSLREFVIILAKRVSGLNDDNLFRSHDVAKYIRTDDVRDHFNDFLTQLFDKMQHEKNRIYVASYILWSIDFTGHYFSDGCSRISILLALWYLMRTGHEMPSLERRLGKERSIRSSYRGCHAISRDEIYDEAVNRQRFNRFYRYYKSLFIKASRPVILCAGGYIFNGKGEVLLLRSAKGKDAGKYVIPGGKMNRTENPEGCFVRETLEETGLSIKNVIRVGVRRYVGPSGRRYMMYDFMAQIDSGSVRINSESVSSEWVQPININTSECTASTLNGLNKYLHLGDMSSLIVNHYKEKFNISNSSSHATGILEERYVNKKLKNYFQELEQKPHLIVLHGIIPIWSVINKVVPNATNAESAGGIVAKDRNSNALRPISVIDPETTTLHLFNFPGDDVLKHYATLFSRYVRSTNCDVEIVRYPDLDQNKFHLTGLTNEIVHGGDIVYLGYSTRLKAYLINEGYEPASISENFWYISSRFRLNTTIINVLECKYGHWGDIAADLTTHVCGLGASAVIHNGKVGTLVGQSEVYSRIYIPKEFAIFDNTSTPRYIPIKNILASFIPFQSSGHISCVTPLDETDSFIKICKDNRIETVDIESSKIADAVARYNKENGRNVGFGAIHYSSDFVGKPDDNFNSYNLTNEHDKDPQSWKDAVLADIFEVIMNEGTHNLR